MSWKGSTKDDMKAFFPVNLVRNCLCEDCSRYSFCWWPCKAFSGGLLSKFNSSLAFGFETICINNEQC